MIALHVGRPLMSLRVDELLAARTALAKDPRVDAAAIDLVGIESLGPAALHAAAVEPAFRTVQTRDSIRSWADDIVARPLAADALSQVLPGVLAHYDLPDFIAKLRRLADALEAGKRFQISIAGERVSVPVTAWVNIEHERGEDGEEIEFQVRWER